MHPHEKRVCKQCRAEMHFRLGGWECGCGYSEVQAAAQARLTGEAPAWGSAIAESPIVPDTSGNPRSCDPLLSEKIACMALFALVGTWPYALIAAYRTDSTDTTFLALLNVAIAAALFIQLGVLRWVLFASSASPKWGGIVVTGVALALYCGAWVKGLSGGSSPPHFGSEADMIATAFYFYAVSNPVWMLWICSLLLRDIQGVEAI